MPAETRDIATVFTEGYSHSAPVVLGDQHRFLLDTLEAHLTKLTNPTLAVIGPGGKVLPYSCTYTPEGKLGVSNRDRIKRMIGKGRIVLIDYIISGGLDNSRDTLRKMGFFDARFFIDRYNLREHEGLLAMAPSFIPRLCTSPQVIYHKHNLMDDFSIRDEIADAIDANLSVHHASVTKAELQRIYSEFFRVLRLGGLLHLGEGNVDMNYSEQKIIRVAENLASAVNALVSVIDERIAADNRRSMIFEPGKKYTSIEYSNNLDLLNGIDSSGRYFVMRVTDDGLISISAAASPNSKDKLVMTSNEAKRIAYKMHNRGHAQILLFSNQVVMPLIDQEMDADVLGLVKPVNRFYDAIMARVLQGYAGRDDLLVEKERKGTDFERANAARGIVEYYMAEATIVETLRKVGFVDIRVKHHETEPFYNITANKPKS